MVQNTLQALFAPAIVLDGPRQAKGAQTLTTTDASSHTLITAGATGVFNDIETIIITNTSATSVEVDISDGTVTYPFYAPAGDMRGITVPTLLCATSAATAWTAQSSSGVSSIKIAATFISRTA
jgi:hypothetical protein